MLPIHAHAAKMWTHVTTSPAQCTLPLHAISMLDKKARLHCPTCATAGVVAAFLAAPNLLAAAQNGAFQGAVARLEKDCANGSRFSKDGLREFASRIPESGEGWAGAPAGQVPEKGKTL